MCTIAAGADDLEHLHAQVLDRRRQRTHRGGTAGNLIDGLGLRRLRGQRCEEGRVLCRARLAPHDFKHGLPCLLVAQIFLVDDFDDGFLNHFCSFQLALLSHRCISFPCRR